LEYQVALTKGIAHAKGTKWFLFAHSAGNPLEANRYNAVFYLINKLMPGDEIDLYVKGQKYNYKATENKIVEAKEVQYMTENKDGRTLTLMTCWPPGTTLKRLLVIAKL
jgi:sortase A